MKERIQSIAETYLSPDYKQHTLILPGPGTDREKLIHLFQNRPMQPPAGARLFRSSAQMPSWPRAIG